MLQHDPSFASLPLVALIKENQALAEIESRLVGNNSLFGDEACALPQQQAVRRSRLPLVLAICAAMVVALLPAGLRKGETPSKVTHEAASD